MKPRIHWSALALVLAGSLTAELTAASPTAASPAGTAPVVDARVRALYAYRDRRGGTLPFYRARRSFELSGMAPLLVRFAREPRARELTRYEKLGFERGRRLDSGAVKVSARLEALEAMEADGVLARVTVDLRPAFRIQPLDHARGELAIGSGVAAWQKTHGTALTGEGVIIGDMDASVDPFHPAFFRAGPPELWSDVDGDGVLTPGIDGVDRDQSGSVEPHEVLRLLDGVAVDLFQTQERIYGTENTGLDPGWDYLFLDENGDGKRNTGAQVAGAEQLPSMGEPLFGLDDVDRDGRIALPERVVPLGASKFLAIEQGGTIYRRGENLSQFAPDQEDSRHATQTMGCAAGGQFGLSRFLGAAPDAELLVSDVYSDISYSWTDNLQWLVDSGANVIVTEMSSFGTEPSDGSSELELLIDAVVEQRSVVVVSPAGNLGNSKKHAFAVIPSASAPAPYQNELVFEEMPEQLAFSVTWREGELTLTGSLTIPDGDVIDLGIEDPVATTAQGRTVSVVHGVTPLGAGYLLFGMNTNGNPLPSRGSLFTLRTSGTTSANAALYAVDGVSGWSGGMGFAQYDVDGCMNSPAFASRTIAISAYALHVGREFSFYPETAGALRAFSGRGPDLWGDPGIDVASPDNPVAATVDRYADGGGLNTRWSEFGGTSGAGAVAVGVAALMRQAHPELSGVALRDAILASARSDAQVSAGTPAEWGAGKLTLGVEAAAGTAPTEVRLVAPANAAPGHPIELEIELHDDGDLATARSRWDFGYDGVWDSEWQDGLTITTEMPDVDHFDVKVEAMDADGWVAPAAVRIGKGEPPLVGVSDEDSEDGGCGCRTAGRARTSAPWALALAALFVALRRRRS